MLPNTLKFPEWVSGMGSYGSNWAEVAWGMHTGDQSLFLQVNGIDFTLCSRMRLWFHWKIRLLDFLRNWLSSHIISLALIRIMTNTSVQVLKKKKGRNKERKKRRKEERKIEKRKESFPIFWKEAIKNISWYLLCLAIMWNRSSWRKPMEKSWKMEREEVILAQTQPRFMYGHQPTCSTFTLSYQKFIFLLLQQKKNH